MKEKTCYRKFFESIPSVLENEPVTTPELYEQMRIAVPECITEEKCDHGNNGEERSGYEWQHLVRSAQSYLKSRGRVELLNHIWYIPKNPDSKDEAEEREAELIYEKQDHAKIREELKSLTPKATEYEEINGIRLKRDNATITKLKILREFKCQICETRIVKRDGTFYAEGAHIKPKREGFPETPDNILILCPNHHKEFDLGKREVLEHNSELLRFIMGGREYKINLAL